MGQDEKALIRLWQEKRGEVGPEDLSANLIVQLGVVTEDLNRVWYERNTGHAITSVQTRVKHPVLSFLAATVDGMVTETGAVYEAKFMLPWSFSEGAAAEKYMAQLQPNMWVTNFRTAALSIITGGGKWVEIAVAADPLYRTSCSPRRKSSGAVSSPGTGLTFSGLCRRSRGSKGEGSRHGRLQRLGGLRRAILFDPRRLEHERAKTELKGLMPEGAKEAFGHGVRAKRSKAGAVSFEMIEAEAGHAPIQ